MDLRHPTVEPDEVWVSTPFTWLKSRAVRAGRFYERQGKKVHYGGTGFDFGRPRGQRIELPPEIYYANADYDLYDDDRAVGFCNRGCYRDCHFCDVPDKEGPIDPRLFRRPREWVPDRFSKVAYLDNDPILYPWSQFRTMIFDCAERGQKTSWTQGLDLRSVTEEQAALLAEFKPYDIWFSQKTVYTAWDRLSSEKGVRRGLQILLDAGFRGHEICVYMVCAWIDDPKITTPENQGPRGDTFWNDMYRFRVLWEEYGVHPYVMPYNNRRDLKHLNHFRRWVNYNLYKICKWEDYEPHAKYVRRNGGSQERLEP